MLKTNLAIALALAASTVNAGTTIFSDGFEEPLPIDYCGSSPLIMPEDFNQVSKTWVNAFKETGEPLPVYPDSGGDPVPLKVNKGAYVTIEFVPNVMQAVSLSWEEAQSIPGYNSPRPGSMYFSVSPCPGDFRVSDINTSDGFLQNGCRKGPTRASGMVWHTFSGFPSDNGSCQLEPGKIYYINQISADPIDGLEPGENKCDFEVHAGCDVIATQHPN